MKLFNIFKKNDTNPVELTPEQIQAAIAKEQKSLKRKETAKRIAKNTLNGILSAAVGIFVYKAMEDHFGGSGDSDAITTTPTTTDDIDGYLAADAATDYTSLEEV